MSALLKIENLSIAFRNGKAIRPVVRNISFDIEHGQTLALVGESGSGKSITALSILRLLGYDKVTYPNGKILFYEQAQNPIDLLTLKFEHLRKIRGGKIGMIFQEPMTSLNPVFTCGYQVQEAISLHKSLSFQETYQKVIDLFEQVRLPNPVEIYKAYPHQLSGGQKQRVMIAMAIACQPSLLIADEPTTALDATVQKSIIELLIQLKQQYKLSMLFISHDLVLVKQIADKVVVMRSGEVVESGTRQQIFDNPQHPYTQALLACRPGLSLPITKLPTINDFESATSYQAVLDHFIQQYPRTKIERSNHFPNILQVQGASVTFAPKGRTKLFSLKRPEPFWALRKVSFDLKLGDILGVVGESGSGKTTLGRAIVKLVKLQEGQILYKQLNLTQLSEQQFRPIRPEIQMIFQDPYAALNPYYTVGQAIEEPIRVYKLYDTKRQIHEKVVSLLEQVSLTPDLYNRYPNQLSGGQRQRVCIARALALNPRILICDESVSALDVSIQAGILNLLNELRQKFQLSLIFISHDLSVVRFLCDQVLVLRNGQVMEMADTQTLFNNPKNDYTRQLIEAIP